MSEVSGIQYTLKYDERKKTATLVKKDGDNVSSITVFADPRVAGKKKLTSKEKDNSDIFDVRDKIKFSGSDKKFDSAVVATFLEKINNKTIDEASSIRGLKTDAGKMFDVSELEDDGAITDVTDVNSLYKAATKADPKRESAGSSNGMTSSDKKKLETAKLYQQYVSKMNALNMINSIQQMTQFASPMLGGMPMMFGNMLGAGMAMNFASQNCFTAALMTPTNSGSNIGAMFEQFIGKSLQSAVAEVQDLGSRLKKLMPQQEGRIIKTDDDDEVEETKEKKEKISIRTEETTSSERSSSSPRSTSNDDENDKELTNTELKEFDEALSDNERKRLGFKDYDALKEKTAKLFASGNEELSEALTSSVRKIAKLKEENEETDNLQKQSRNDTQIAKEIDKIKNILVKGTSTTTSTGSTGTEEDGEKFEESELNTLAEKIGLSEKETENIKKLLPKLSTEKQNELIAELKKAENLEESDNLRNGTADQVKTKIKKYLNTLFKTYKNELVSGEYSDELSEKESGYKNQAKSVARTLTEFNDYFVDHDKVEKALEKMESKPEIAIYVLEEYEKNDPRSQDEKDKYGKGLIGQIYQLGRGWNTYSDETKTKWITPIKNALAAAAKAEGVPESEIAACTGAIDARINDDGHPESADVRDNLYKLQELVQKRKNARVRRYNEN